MQNKEDEVLKGLKLHLGLKKSADHFEILKAAAEALGYSVDDSGKVQQVKNLIIDDEPRKKKRRADLQEDSKDNNDEESEEKLAEDEEDDDEEDEGEEDEDEEEDDDDEEEEEIEVDDSFTQPIEIVDDRDASKTNTSPTFTTIQDSEELFSWLIAPLDIETFYDAVYEQQPAFISRPNSRDYYKGLLSRQDIHHLLTTAPGLQYSHNIDVTHYSRKGVRENFNFNNEDDTKDGDGSVFSVADAHVVWDRLDTQGCSLRLLHPQRFCDSIWHLLSRLEDFWKSPLGSNAYLTPPGCQGFAPHFDDIDAFILQLEGAKRWKLHAPTSPQNILPRHSSRDFTQEELGECVLDVVLHPGDLLYMPRGQVHQAVAAPDSDTDSLHLTISVNQQRTWQGLFEELLPRALTVAASHHRFMRSSVPREFTMAFGTAPLPYIDDKDDDGDGDDGVEDEREEERSLAKTSVLQHAQHCLKTIMESVDFDFGADEWDSQFLVSRLPPVSVSAHPNNGKIGREKSSSSKKSKLKATTRFQIGHPGCARLYIDADGEKPMALVAHCMANTRSRHAEVSKPRVDDDVDKPTTVDNGPVPSVLEFPIECAETISEFLAAGEQCKNGVSAEEVVEPSPGGGVSALDVAVALVQAGVLKRIG